MMKIVTWNVNGVRAIHRKGEWQKFITRSDDIFCLQETKASPEQLLSEIVNLEGYSSYFASSVVKKGYSGVATYSKIKPDFVAFTLGEKRFDDEGRVVETHFGDLVLLNVYFPNGGGGPHRIEYKLNFYDVFLKHIDKLGAGGKKIIFCGDVNTAHKEIDLARPKENVNNTGFLPIERAWLDKVVSHGYIDVFRYFYPDKRDAYTYWDLKSAARERNVGWRIDYFFVSPDLKNNLNSIKILDHIFGSDHCPLEMSFTI